MKTYKIFVGGFQIGTEELTAEEVKKMNNSGIVVVPVEKQEVIIMNKIFFEGKQIEGVQELREDVENFVILAAGNFPGCSQRKIIFPKNEVEIEEREQTIFIDWK